MIRLTGALALLLSAGIGGWMALSRQRVGFEALVMAVTPGEVSLVYLYRDGKDVQIEEDGGLRLERRNLMSSGNLQRFDSFVDVCTLRVPPHVSGAIPEKGNLTIRQTKLGHPFARLGIRHTSFHGSDTPESAGVPLRPVWRFWGACALVAAAPLLPWALAALLAAALTPRKRTA